MRRLVLLAGLAVLALPAQASAQLPYFTTPPPPEHRAVGGYQTLRRTDLVTPPPVAGSIVLMDVVARVR